MEASDQLNVASPADPSPSTFLLNSAAASDQDPLLKKPSPLDERADLSAGANDVAKSKAHADANDDRAKRRAEKKAMKKALKEGQTLVQQSTSEGDGPASVDDVYHIKRELKAREAELKEAKRALKKARKLEKQLGKENNKEKKRQRSPSPGVQAQEAEARLQGPDNLDRETEKRRQKRIRTDIGHGELDGLHNGDAAEADRGERKRKRDEGRDRSPAPASEAPIHDARQSERAFKKKKFVPIFPEDLLPVQAPGEPLSLVDPNQDLANRFASSRDSSAPSKSLDINGSHLEEGSVAPTHGYQMSTATGTDVEPPSPAVLPTAQQSHNEPADISNEHGAAVQLPQAQPGFYSTFYYPLRTQPLQVPTGKLSAKAKKERYKGLTTDEITKREEEYERLSKDCPKVFQEAFKHTARGRLDKVAHHWLVPRVQNYYLTQPDGRSGLLDRIVRDLVNEFPDLHPNFLKLKDSSMEKDYLASLRNMVSVAASGVKSALGNPTKVENIDKDIIKFLTGTTVAPRAHDLWAKCMIKKAKEEAEKLGESDTDRPERPSDRTPNILTDWEAHFDEAVKIHGKKYANSHRLELEQDFRKKKFEELLPEERKIWDVQAATFEKPYDRLEVVANGLPFMNHVFKRFAETAEIPMLVLLGAPDFRNPREVIIYHDTYSPAPSNVPDFFNGPDRFGEKVLVPAFRAFIEKCLGDSADHVATEGISLPTAPEPSPDGIEPEADPSLMQVEEVTSFGLTARSGVRFVVTPAPKDWLVPSKEQDNVKKEIKSYISETFKKAYNKRRCKFATLSARADQFFEPSILPTTKFVTVLENDGTTSFKEGKFAQIVAPSDPLAMPWYHVKAWYDLLKNPQSRFIWRIEESTAVANIINPPKSVKDSLEKPHSEDPVDRKAGKGKNGPKPRRNPKPATSNNAQTSSDGSAKSNPRSKKKSISESESEAVLSENSAKSSPFTLQSDSSSGESYDPNAEYVLRPQTISRSGRRSAPPAATPRNSSTAQAFGAGAGNSSVAPAAACDDDSDKVRTEPGDTTQPAPVPQRPNVLPCASEALLVSPEKTSTGRSQPNLSEATPLYILKPCVEPHATNIPSELEAMLENVRDLSLSLPKTSRAGTPPTLDLYAALNCCVRLDVMFPARQPPALSLPSAAGLNDTVPNRLKIFWDNINDPFKPVPLFLAATQLATDAGTDVRSVALEVERVSVCLVDILEGHDLIEDGQFGANSCVSWTRYLVLLARYLKFIQSVEPSERNDGSEGLGILHERVLDLTIIHLALRYCVGVMVSHIQSFPAPSASPSIANTISTLGSSWVRLIKRLSCPINKLSLNQVCGTNWAHAVDPSGQPAASEPFSHLGNASQQWITVRATSNLYDAIIELEKDLHSDADLINEMSIYEQLTFLASFFAVHANEKIRGCDEDWLGIVDGVLEAIESQEGGGERHETELKPRQPPPTLVSSGQTNPTIQKRERPRPYDKNSWHPGDTARVIVDEKEQEVVFAVKQKYGGSRSLVMANAKTMKELFAPDGETPLPLPQFSDDLLISRGPNDITALARYRVPGHWDLPNLEFSDTMRPELAGYFAQFERFADSNDDPDELEKLGFKPPEYFIKQYQARAAKEFVKLHTDSAEVAAPHFPADALVTASREPRAGRKSHPFNVDTRTEGSVQETGGDGNSTPPPEKEEVAREELGKGSGEQGGSNEGEPVEPVREGDEEEEVENVLGEDVHMENASTPKQTGKASTTSKKTGPKKEKGRQASGSKKNDQKPKPVTSTKPATIKERSLPTRSSSRLRTADTDTAQAPEAGPSQTTRRTSLRNNKDVPDPTPQTTRGPTTRSKG
ncbi:hypothetical protein M407DRAFT_23838 [Tulasnella calospora MUT 4182]|uniref:Uncharacterized protein n=1 Tax=Tulasnella calospora MUT 4182 TaxID=1051891 RepID=A0A0C3QIW5_9AGAM|nr:hypothetical protein M407DRAFT_23838 [Tulasnella calospora MUT 4182]